jgi:excisionase family DNA binding protein
MSKYISIAEVADLFGVTDRTVRNWISEGKLEAYKVGPRAIRILESSLDLLCEPIHRQGRRKTN